MRFLLIPAMLLLAACNPNEKSEDGKEDVNSIFSDEKTGGIDGKKPYDFYIYRGDKAQYVLKTIASYIDACDRDCTLSDTNALIYDDGSIVPISNKRFGEQRITHMYIKVWPKYCGDESYTMVKSVNHDYIIEHSFDSTEYPNNECMVNVETLINGALSFSATVRFKPGEYLITDHS